jgi:hypothetical protein
MMMGLERRRVTARQWGSAACAQDFEFQSWLLRLGVRYPPQKASNTARPVFLLTG